MLYLYLLTIENEEERETIRAVYEENRNFFLNIAKQITHEQTAAEEALHNAFVSVIFHKEKFFKIPCNKRRAYIVIIIKNKAIDYVRSRGRSKTVSFSAGTDDELFTDCHDISSRIENEEELARLKKLINSLPEKYKSVFELRYIHDLNNGEIAEAVGIKKETVALWLSRVKKRLKKALEYGEPI